MNAFLKKEIRLLLPSFLIGCALTLANWFLFWENQILENSSAINGILTLIPLMVCPAVAVMLALDSFGVEVSSGTFTNLLAQPLSRLKIWQTKISLLAVALLVFGVLWFVPIFYVRLFMATNHDSAKELSDLFTVAVMFALVVFPGGLWTVLLLRQVAAAFWFTLLVPGVILVILVGLLADHSGEFIEGMVVSVLGVYSLAGFFFARWLFFRAQDLQWSGGTIVMPEIRGLPAWLAKSSLKRILRPRAALWRKEFQLHQSQFVMAFALLLLHLGVIALRTFGHFQKNSSTEFILEVFWGLWLVMPLLVGCAAVAEERKLGTLEGQLCLPVKWRTQFTIKFIVVLFLSVALGVVVPLLLEGTKILPKVQIQFSLDNIGNLPSSQLIYWSWFQMLNGFLPLLLLVGVAIAFGVISFYVSSLMRNTLQTLAPAALGILVAFFGLIVVGQLREFNLDFLWHGPLPYFIGVPVMSLALVALAFANFQHVRTGWKMWRQNFFVFALAFLFAVTATSAVYHRAWEKLTPFEPPHGAAKLSQSNPASLNAQWDRLSVRLPDGRIWMANFMPSPDAHNLLALLRGNVKVAVDEGKFIGGSNWATVKRAGGGLVGLKTDGSLWVSEGFRQPKEDQTERWVADDDAVRHLVPFENETNWSSFVPRNLSALLVKNDGTLWHWGATNWNWKNKWPGLQSFTPQRLGTQSDWAEVFQSTFEIFLRKADGSLWTWNDNWNTNGETQLEITPEFTVHSVKNLGLEKFRSTTRISHGLQFNAGVRDDGTFRIWADERVVTRQDRRYGDYAWFATDLQIGDGTNWIAVAGWGEKIVTLKDDGSLWLWNFHDDFRRGWDSDLFEGEIQKVRPVRLGTHSDWIAISGDWGSVTTLAADGSLWFWQLESVSYVGEFNGTQYLNNGDSSFESLLEISRKPQLLGNVLGKTD
jgi:alpha-tubulin suppressor-like RCC1 family protein